METNANQKVTCVANYAYEASEPDELTIRPGEVLRDVERLPGGWWRGELRGRRGMFPDNFVSVTTDQNNASSTGASGRCRAVFSYQPANPDELPLCVGDVLDVLGEVEEGWWQGRRQGRVGVFPSNFVVMLDSPQPPPYETTAFEPAPALPPKPVKELCRVLFPYTAVNEDELTLAEGDIVTIVSKEAPDRGWWRGELHGRVGLFPDNFVQLLPPVTHDTMEEKKPDRPPSKNSIYPVLNKYSEKTASVKELTTSKISTHKENTLSKENNTTSTVTHTNKSESEKLIHSETITDGSPDSQGKKPPVPLKKSPTPTSGVTGLFSGLKNKMLSTDKDKEKSSTIVSSGSSSGGEWDRPDGGGASKAANNNNTFDHVERNSILNDPRAGRVKAPRRRPPSQALRDDTPQQIGLSNGHEVPGEKPAAGEKPEEIKPRAREWEKHRAPWMEELKLNQAKKTSFDGKTGKGMGSTDRILEVGLEEKRSSHSMEMSKSTSSISSRMSVLESFEETKTRHSTDNKTTAPKDPEPAARPVHSPTAAGRTLLAMLDDIKKPPGPPAASARSNHEPDNKNAKIDIQKTTITSEKNEVSSSKSGVFEKSTVERLEKTEEKEKAEKPAVLEKATTLERRQRERSDSVETLVAQLNNRISNLEKLLEVQNAKFNAAIEELTSKLAAETERRVALQAELHKLAHCVTQV
ncbi:LOW QUALITY PROTEIN: CD2-associated protein-like [Leguminivora glycinivorella]|uniref:LOW QUALITY PROTEIN: CD2-associated protein-like n=1 Tax=Leguminivora glycinivorella TaxID=1035111 RepID=UPI00200F699C|nr:LOW QUALITY PROTEIN: CD2-associated protein-like [Leguminivora glycinivorella]